MLLETPPPLRVGDTIAVVAPSSGFDRRDLWRGLGWLRERYRVRVPTSLLARDGYLAGDDDRRAAELAAALEDDDVRAVVAARGGYGAMRIVDRLPWDAFVRRPKWIVGFSDITALHVVAWGRGVASVHAPNVTGLGLQRPPGWGGVARGGGNAGASPAVRASWTAALEAPRRPRAWRGLTSIHDGPVAEGPLVGGNLALLAAMAAAGRLAIPDDAVVAIEDVTERPYRIDRMLTSLLLGGHLARAVAIVVGDFAQCDAGPDGTTWSAVVADRTRALGVPVVAGAPFGHGETNEAWVVGAPVRVERNAVNFL